MTALHDASFKGHLEVVRLLLEKGADIELKTKVSAARTVRVVYGGGN
jgi:ankyrin repeat protein